MSGEFREKFCRFFSLIINSVQDSSLSLTKLCWIRWKYFFFGTEYFGQCTNFPRIINTTILLYFQKVLTLKLWQTPSSRQSFFCFIFASYGGEYNVIVRDSEPIRLLESPRALSVYILVSNLKLLLNLALVGNEELCSSKSVFYTLLFIQNNSWIRTKLKHAYLYRCYVHLG